VVHGPCHRTTQIPLPGTVELFYLSAVTACLPCNSDIAFAASLPSDSVVHFVHNDLALAHMSFSLGKRTQFFQPIGPLHVFNTPLESISLHFVHALLCQYDGSHFPLKSQALELFNLLNSERRVLALLVITILLSRSTDIVSQARVIDIATWNSYMTILSFEL